MTLIELIVAAGLMTVVLAVAGTGLSTVYQTFGRAESGAIAQQQISLAFQKLDREVRYASAISTPAVVGGDAYVEYLTMVSSVSTCVQLRLQTATGRLQRRTWRSDLSPAPPLASTVLATQVTPGADAPSTTMPFTVWPADVANSFDRLRISLRADAGRSRTAASATVAVTFAAVNSSPEDSEPAPCVSGRGVS